MAVSRIRVSGLKCFAGRRAVDLTLDPEPGWTVLAGPNGSGKSTLLAALALALGAPEPADPERWLARGTDEGTVELPGLARWNVARTGTSRTGPATPHYYGPSRRPRLPEHIPPGALPFLADGILPRGWTTDHGLPLVELGSGRAALAALVIGLSALDPDEITTALVDDIDAHLHPTWQQRIGGWLTAHFPQVQFIVATHSPYVCQAADPGTLVRLAGPEEEPAPPRLLDEELHQRILYGSGDDAALSELFGLPSAYSPAAELERQLLVRLERKLYAGQASRSELAEYQKLGARLNSSLSARADEIAARHLGRER